MRKHKLPQSDTGPAQKPLTRAERVALLARIIDVMLSGPRQPHIRAKAETDLVYYCDLPALLDLDNEEHIAGSASDQQSAVQGLSNEPLLIAQLSLPPEAQALRQVTMHQAAQILGVHTRTIRRLIQAGELSAVGRGRLTRIALQDIAAYQQRNRR